MNEYEKSFILKVGRVKSAGIDFQGLAREALTGKFGGAADVLLRGLSVRAMSEPEHFVREVSKIFGRGAMGVYEPIVNYVDMGLYGSSGTSPILALLRQLGPAGSGDVGGKSFLLHEHRIQDEEGNYSDDAS